MVSEPGGQDVAAYSQPLRMGRYQKPSGMLGKYDNVRRLWEDRATGFFLRPHLRGLVEDRGREARGLRILDLGCGAGDGLDLLRCIPAGRLSGMDEPQSPLVPDEMLELYVGVDVNDDLLAQARGDHDQSERVRFTKGDLSSGLPLEILDEHGPFDLYFSSYAMLSHLREEECAELLADACIHAERHALFVGDWLGQYSYEWQDLWSSDAEPDVLIDYRMSYLYPERKCQEMEIPTFPLRLMTPLAVDRIATSASGQAGRECRPVSFLDRSILVGRHTDTREYNENCVFSRRAVNSLLESDVRTNLSDLYVDYRPRPGFDRVNRFYQEYFGATNRLVSFAATLLAEGGRSRNGHALFTEPRFRKLRQWAVGLQKLVEVARCIEGVDTRANLVEPLLARVLWSAEMELQSGLGAGHSLCAVIDIRG